MTDEMTWPQFKHQHSGIENEEISILWKKYKEGRYFIGESNAVKSKTEEYPRDEEEQKALEELNPEEVKENEAEEVEDVEETLEIEPVEPPQSEEEPQDEPEPTPEPQPPQNTSEEEASKRLRDNAIYGI
tara:strand:+ start:12012 stop:12401 length:390 start_codon:yes stop_codon:yes gene_type:complete